MNVRALLIEKLGGYTKKGYLDAEEAIECITDPVEKKRLLTLAVKKSFNTIGPEDILQVDRDGKWMLMGKPVSNSLKSRLIAEATQFQKSVLWKTLKADVKHQANQATFIKAASEYDLIAGKLWHWTFDVLKTRLKSLAGESAVYNSEPHR